MPGLVLAGVASGQVLLYVGLTLYSFGECVVVCVWGRDDGECVVMVVCVGEGVGGECVVMVVCVGEGVGGECVVMVVCVVMVKVVCVW